MALDFILQIICKIHQIRNPKRPLFRVKSQKNDTIGSATLIAPEITSGIKSGMYGFYSVLTWDVTIWRIIASLTAHVNRSMNTAMNASVKRALLRHGFSFSKPLCGYKRWERGLCQKHQSVADMIYPWCSCSLPPDFYVVPSNERC